MADVHFPTPDGELPAYLATPPTGSGPWPGVVVIFDAVGMSDDMRQQADHLATAGYVTLLPDLYARGGRFRCVAATMRAARSGVGPAYDDIEAGRAWLAARGDCTGRIGVIGFCMGGAFALALAPTKRYAASSVNYGFVPDDIDARLADGACPVIGSFGARDRTLPGHAGKLEDALTKAGVEHDIKEYPGVGHSFLNRFNVGPMAPLLRVTGFAYDHTVAADAWTRILRFFDEHLRQHDG